MSSAEWIESAGGPLVIIARSARNAWKGIATKDYADACAVEEYVGLLGRVWGDVLVLGDEPLRTTVVYRPEGSSIVRWMCAPDAEQLLNTAQRVGLDGLHPVETLTVDMRDEPYIIFDSGSDGAGAASIEFTPPPQTRGIKTYLIKDDASKIGMILHTFTR